MSFSVHLRAPAMSFCVEHDKGHGCHRLNPPHPGFPPWKASSCHRFVELQTLPLLQTTEDHRNQREKSAEDYSKDSPSWNILRWVKMHMYTAKTNLSNLLLVSKKISGLLSSIFTLPRFLNSFESCMGVKGLTTEGRWLRLPPGHVWSKQKTETRHLCLQ